MSKEIRDVIVVGAGPAGSTAAQAIAEAGYDVLLLDREKEIGSHNSCGGGIGYFLKDLFDLPDDLIQKEICDIKLQLGEKTKVYHSNKPLYASVLRKDFDNFLANRAAEKGAELVTETKALDYDPYHKVLTCLHRPTRTKVQYKARLVIFADGAKTLAWKTCQIGLPWNKANLIGIARELYCPGHGLESYEFIFDEKILPYGYFWVFPKGDTINVGVGGPFDQLSGKVNQMLEKWLDTRPELKDLKAVSVTSGLIPGTIPKKLHCAGAMAIGDAGGFLNPLTGGGIFLSMKSAQVAAKTAIEALRAGRYDSHFLARYTHRIKFSPIYPSIKFFEFLVNWSQRYSQRTGRPMLGYVFRIYSDLMFHLLKVIKDI
jgi:digeranylgeranylglycerophospholipid reductase